jgi:hypothetical protein
MKAQLLTTRDRLEFVSSNWQSTCDQIPVTDIVRVEGKGNSIVLSLRLGCRYSTVTLIPTAAAYDRLLQAVSADDGVRVEERVPVCKVVIDSFMGQPGQVLYKELEDESRQLFQLLRGRIIESESFVDVLLCGYRMRFANDLGLQREQAVQLMGMDVKRWIIVNWCDALLRAIQPANEPIAVSFRNAIAVNIAATIEKVASNVGLWVNPLKEAMEAANFPGNPGLAEKAAKSLKQEAVEGIEKDLRMNPPNDTGALRFLEAPIVIAASAAAIEMYEQDLEEFARVVVDYTSAVMERSQVDPARSALLERKNALLKDLLRFLDGQRYGSNFQWIYCVWGLRTTSDSY